MEGAFEAMDSGIWKGKYTDFGSLELASDVVRHKYWK